MYSDKSPISKVGRLQSKIIADSRRDIQSGAEVSIRFGPLVAEDVLEMIGPEWTAVLPLRVTNQVSLANSDPVILANGLPGCGVRLLEPRNNERRFRFKLPIDQIVVRQGDIERILSGNKRNRNVIPSTRCLRRIKTAITHDPT